MDWSPGYSYLQGCSQQTASQHQVRDENRMWGGNSVYEVHGNTGGPPHREGLGLVRYGKNRWKTIHALTAKFPINSYLHLLDNVAQVVIAISFSPCQHTSSPQDTGSLLGWTSEIPFGWGYQGHAKGTWVPCTNRTAVENKNTRSNENLGNRYSATYCSENKPNQHGTHPPPCNNCLCFPAFSSLLFQWPIYRLWAYCVTGHLGSREPQESLSAVWQHWTCEMDVELTWKGEGGDESRKWAWFLNT